MKRKAELQNSHRILSRCERLQIVSNTLMTFWKPSQAGEDIDTELLSKLGEPTDFKKWLGASLDKTIRLHLDIRQCGTGSKAGAF